MRVARCGSLSTAVTSMPASSSRWPVLPPGAAQASSTRMPSATSSSGAASCAPASCTDTTPSAKPGNCVTGTARTSRTACGPTTVPARPALARSVWYCFTLTRAVLTRSVIGGRTLTLAASSVHCSGYASRSMRSHHGGRFQRACSSRLTSASSALRSRRKRRSTALTRPRACAVLGSDAAALTAWSTTVKVL
ncbi:hypothetical protein D9M70_488480 [compost metagenome]